MKNIFAAKDPVGGKLKRNTYDLTHRENLTMNFGKLYPCGAPIEVLPNDTVEFSLTAAIHAMPLDFPVQSNMTMKVYAFYVRSRIVWDNQENYITGVYDNTSKKPVHPWCLISTQEDFDRMCRTGSLGDYLGLPTTKVGDFGSFVVNAFNTNNVQISMGDTPSLDGTITSGIEGAQPLNVPVGGLTQSASVFGSSCYLYLPVYSGVNTWLDIVGTQRRIPYDSFLGRGWLYDDIDRVCVAHCPCSGPELNALNDRTCLRSLIVKQHDDVVCSFGGSRLDPTFMTTHVDELTAASYSDVKAFIIWFSVDPGAQHSNAVMFAAPKCKFWYDSGLGLLRYATLGEDLVSEINYQISLGKWVFPVFVSYLNDGTVLSNNFFCYAPTYNTRNTVTLHPGIRVQYARDQVTLQDATFEDSPFVGAVPKVPLNAIPFRVYEACCNSYFRNDKIDPILDGNNEPVYNRYVTNTGDGADPTPYDFRHANYELDFLTDAVPSPQFGPAPLVGLTISSGNTATLHFDASSIVGTSPQSTGGTLNAKVTFTDDDNMTITGITSYDHDLPDGNLRNLMQQINYGISINDLRNVNALQRFLERMQLRSYRYKDQILNHFGQHVDNVDVDMPEYIGGYNFPIQVNKINNNSAPSIEGQAPLGDYAGQASIKGNSRTIRCHCPEHGYIIVLACVVPRPTYTQLLPKFWTKTVSKFDYFFPEFGKKGHDPIKNYEVSPLQFAAYDHVNGTDTIHDTFGYQRAWYDYIQYVDGAHGDFRLSLANYLAMRLFNERPQLSPRFIEVHDEDVNNIFSIKSYDHFLGYIDYVGSIRRGIPRHGMPSLS